MIADIIQPTHLVLILVVALLILGPKRLPEAGRSLGTAIKDFRSGISGLHDESGSGSSEPVAMATLSPNDVTIAASHD